MQFRKAERKQAKLRLALCGPSGSGKTRGGIMIAKGLGGKIAMPDTERRSGSLYSHLADFDVCEVSAPFTPSRFIDGIKQAESLGYNVLIIDSLSHAWSGIGGVLDMQDAATKASNSKNSYFAWREVTPEHNRLVDTILQSKMHIIVCMRVKTVHDIVEQNGKKTPVKIGLAPVQREGLDYEFTVVLDLDHDSHVYTCSKDRTELFDGKHEKLSEQTGIDLIAWLNDGSEDSSEKLYAEYISKINDCENIEDLKKIFADAKNSSIHDDRILFEKITVAAKERKTQFPTEETKDIPQ